MTDHENAKIMSDLIIVNINLNGKIKKLTEALKDIINTGLCNLPDIRCDDDMFKIAEEILKD